jgi:hypothetical protein
LAEARRKRHEARDIAVSEYAAQCAMNAEQRRCRLLAANKPVDRFIWNAPARDQCSGRSRHRQLFIFVILSAGDRHE